MTTRKPRIGVFKFSSCDGCQLTVLDCEDELLDLAERVDIAYFLEAIRRPLEGEFDIALVEGSVYTSEQEEYIRDIRQRSRFLITLGACAAHGGIQALRNFTPPEEYPRVVYALPQYIESLAKSRPTGDYVPVDLELQGCPISKQQLLRVLAQMLLGSKPRVPNHALCLDCKRQNIVCVLVAQGKPCMGPVTTTGCGVLCPSYDRVRVGGFYHVPSKKELEQLGEELKSAHDLARQTVRWAANLDFPPIEHDYEFVALRHPAEYPMNEGRLVSSLGLDIAMSEFPDRFAEYQVPYSNAYQCRRKHAGAYYVGPLARWNLNFDRVPASIRQAAAETGIAWPCRNPYMSIVARSLEVLYSVEEAMRIIAGYVPPDQPAISYQPRAGQGAWITEAPHGILYHRYETDASGSIRQASIIPPTSQNQLQIEDDLLRLAPQLVNLPEEEAALRAEKVIRNYDPCISCSTHFLKIRVERR